VGERDVAVRELGRDVPVGPSHRDHHEARSRVVGNGEDVVLKVRHGGLKPILFAKIGDCFRAEKIEDVVEKLLGFQEISYENSGPQRRERLVDVSSPALSTDAEKTRYGAELIGDTLH